MRGFARAGGLVAALAGVLVTASPADAQPPPPAEPTPALPDDSDGADGANDANGAPTAPPVAPVPAPPPAAEAAPAEPSPADDIGDQAVAAHLGVATGGRVTPGGLRIEGHYHYQLAERDWFDGMVAFTFGSGEPACFRDRQNVVVCDHGLADGSGIELSARIRRVFAPRGAFYPFAHVGLGVGIARFSEDGVAGLTLPLHGGGGVRMTVTRLIAVVAEADLALGFGAFDRGLDYEPQLGLTITGGVEFRL